MAAGLFDTGGDGGEVVGGETCLWLFASVRQGSCYLHARKIHVLSSGRQICRISKSFIRTVICVRLPVMSPDRLLES